MKTVLMVTVATIVLSYGTYRFFRHILYKRDTINKESIARLIKYLLIFLDILVILGQFDATKPIMSYIAASSGIVAIILGVAAQDTFGNLCAGLMILLFKPFIEGDLIKVNQGELIGYVESIHFRHTVIRTYENNRVIVPNSSLNSSTIENAFYQDEKKDNYLEIEVSYGTDIDLAIDIFKNLTKEVMNKYGMPGSEDLEVKVIKFTTTGIGLRMVIPSKSSLDGFNMLSDIRYGLIKEYDKAGIDFGNYPLTLTK